ncbi:glycerol-3-phosphate 1-O-acyltransferase PlsY [Paenirhodobacter populi]|uniref:Glycerol-3-phosphate acyltransferase n=1 Tax=Paenirhodobacter populi TaxID=2306993 RepID=A0A443KEB2_9RHOB|nr:glycerol-3-phosphate 1-O-acyltransferase PlsY [Sinirhodobacter populi]RWR10021.1 glycerol-3-phosphate 1-O-acyltransferase PlsY [Sinirhodobacter populi]RWR11418.1 glycerol-3-phosphate 1-O-acyltransferase PlsY [Sinirhodobacter populi]RWR20226.1 glycerol-3-phosphate 1-O-acyltransferase PlsY [Sinirhodobacter populi]RWR26426.1 glycerol-3-phosphate 1-O-acyltransferase PlsY [Sinirhodobacter populi]RWR30952.1 glycerol-3-phosphate 1-O-acyltransferase PlsY [Sinirhodobacter populi]
MPEAGDGAAILAAVALLGYMLGSIPFGVVITKLMGLGDLRQIGSGNIGATNVLRTGNKAAAAATLILDGAKGAVAVLLVEWFLGSEAAAQIAGVAAFIGHLYPVWLRFRGGKGVATFLGTLLALAWPLGIAACLAWLVTALVTRISSLSALVAAALSVPLAQILGYRELMPAAAIMAVLIFWRHRANIQRLAQGREPKIGKKT